jgi:hypothetical protein
MGKRNVSALRMTIGSSLLLLSVALPNPAGATHEAEHRFTVYGYVRDDNGKPLSSERVIVVDKRLDQANTTFTDHEGYYEALLHIHDTDLGDEIAVMAGEKQKSIRAEFDPKDHETERKARVDFGAPPSAGSAGSPAAQKIGLLAIVVAGAVVLMIGLVRYGKRDRQKGKKGRKSKKQR